MQLCANNIAKIKFFMFVLKLFCFFFFLKWALVVIILKAFSHAVFSHN